MAEFAYSFYGSDWPDVLMGMLACFDASGHESDQPYLVVAGFVSSAKDWDEFSVEWLKRLSDDGLPFFRAADFEGSYDVFQPLKGQEHKRQALRHDLMEIIKGHVYRYFVSGVASKELSVTFSKEERKQFNINAYAICGRSCVADLGRWLRPDGRVCGPAPELVFERGDVGAGMLTKLLVDHGYPEPLFRPGKKPLATELGEVLPFVPLQAADWLAYECFQLLKHGTDDRGTWTWAMQQFYQTLQGVPGFWLPEKMEQVKKDLDALNRGNAAPVVLAKFLDDGEHFV